MGAVGAATRAPARRRRKFRPTRALRYVILSAGAVLFVAPFAYMVTSSFQPLSEIFSYPPKWIPTDPTLQNYRDFFGSGHQIGRWIVNSAFTTAAITVAQLFFSSLVAYTFAKRTFPGRDVLFFLMLATMMLPVQITVIPNYLILKGIPLFGGNDLSGVGGHGWLDGHRRHDGQRWYRRWRGGHQRRVRRCRARRQRRFVGWRRGNRWFVRHGWHGHDGRWRHAGRNVGRRREHGQQRRRGGNRRQGWHGWRPGRNGWNWRHDDRWNRRNGWHGCHHRQRRHRRHGHGRRRHGRNRYGKRLRIELRCGVSNPADVLSLSGWKRGHRGASSVLPNLLLSPASGVTAR